VRIVAEEQLAGLVRCHVKAGESGANHEPEHERSPGPPSRGFPNGVPGREPGDRRYCARWQFPELRHASTSEHVAGWPSIVQLQPNVEHHHCWPLAIDL
jgi:hypothetical protein